SLDGDPKLEEISFEFAQRQVRNLSSRDIEKTLHDNRLVRVIIQQARPLVHLVSDNVGENEQGCQMDQDFSQLRIWSSKIHVERAECVAARAGGVDLRGRRSRRVLNHVERVEAAHEA